MADEIKIGLSLKCNAFANQARTGQTVSNVSVTMTGAVISSGTQLIGTTKEALDLRADHTTPGWVMLWNLDDTNYVSYGEDADDPFGEMKWGEPALFRLSRTQSGISLKADTAAVTIYYEVYED